MIRTPDTRSQALARRVPAASLMAVVGPAMAVVSRIAGRIIEGIEYRRTVAALSRLDERTLKDIGVDRMEITHRTRDAVSEGRR